MRNGARGTGETSVLQRCARVTALVACAGSLLTAEVAEAQPATAGADETADVTAECVDAFGRSQTLRDDGRLLEARKALESCARAECPDVVTSKCMPWLEQVNADLPSIVVAAKDAQGNDVVDVRVLLGETVLTESLDGRPLDLDPGAHTLRFEHRGAPAVEQQIVARQGEKLRSVEVRFATPAEPTPEPGPKPGTEPSATPPLAPSGSDATVVSADEVSSGGVSSLAWIGFSVAGAGLVVGTIAGIAAFGEADFAREKCETQCTQEDIDAGIVVAHISTVGFVVAGIGATLGVVGLLLPTDDTSNETGSVRLTVGPGALGLSGRF